jgi:hypothetical protein
VDDIPVTYFRARNEHDRHERRRLLERSVTDDAVLLDPTRRWEGATGLAEARDRTVLCGTLAEVVM